MDELMPFRPDGQDWAGRFANDAFGHISHHQMQRSTATVCANDHHVDVVCNGIFNDFDERLAVYPAVGHFDPLEVFRQDPTLQACLGERFEIFPRWKGETFEHRHVNDWVFNDVQQVEFRAESVGKFQRVFRRGQRRFAEVGWQENLLQLKHGGTSR